MSPADSTYDFAPGPEKQPEVPARAGPFPPIPSGAERICPHCGFRVVGKPRGNRCPECSAPLDLAAADLLQFAPAGWIREISWGPVLIALAMFVHIGGLLSWPLAGAIQRGMEPAQT